jgi:hypothetical protein
LRKRKRLAGDATREGDGKRGRVQDEREEKRSGVAYRRP